MSFFYYKKYNLEGHLEAFPVYIILHMEVILIVFYEAELLYFEPWKLKNLWRKIMYFSIVKANNLE